MMEPKLETFMVNTGTVLLIMNSELDCAVNLSVVMDTMDTGNTLPSTSIYTTKGRDRFH